MKYDSSNNGNASWPKVSMGTLILKITCTVCTYKYTGEGVAVGDDVERVAVRRRVDELEPVAVRRPLGVLRRAHAVPARRRLQLPSL